MFEAQLPRVPDRCEGVVVSLRLRGKDELGTTFLRSMREYARRLRSAGATLMLVGVNPRVMSQFETTGVLDEIGPDCFFPEQPRLGDSLAQALAVARARRRLGTGGKCPPRHADLTSRGHGVVGVEGFLTWEPSDSITSSGRSGGSDPVVAVART